MPVAGLPGADAGSLVASATVSVVVSAAGMVMLKATRPKDTEHGLARVLMHRGLGVTGTMLIFCGLVLSSVPYLVGVSSDAESKAAQIIQTFLVLLCWLGERFLLLGYPMHLAQTLACFLVWLGSILVEYAGPRPYDNLSAGLNGQIGGCDGRYRSPFLVYAGIWLTGLVFGVLLMLLEELPENPWLAAYLPSIVAPADEDASLTSSAPKRDRRIVRKKALPFVYGLATSMSTLAFAVGAASDQMFLVFFGAMLLVLASLCAWDWLWRLELPLSSWAALSLGLATLGRLAQMHLVYRDLRWDPLTEYGFLTVWRYPGLPLFFLGFLILVASLVLFQMGGETGGWIEEDWEVHQPPLHDSDSEEDEEVLLGASSVACRCVAFVLLGACFTCLLVGLCVPMIETRVQKPGFSYEGRNHHMTMGEGGPGFSDRKSMLQTVSLLYTKRLPCSAMVVGYTFIISPPLQLAAALVLLLKPRWLPLDMYPTLRQWVLDQAPFRFTNPFVVMLLVSFLNFGLQGPSGGLFYASFQPGFWLILAYCFLSVILAQVLMFGVRLPRRHMQSTSEYEDEEDDSVWERFYTARYVAALVIVIALPIVCLSVYFAVTRPFLTFEYRVSSIVVEVLEPTVAQLHDTLASLHGGLATFVWTTFVGLLVVWGLCLLIRIPFALGVDCDIGLCNVGYTVQVAEQLLRPWVMTHLWGVCLASLYYVATGRNKAIVEVCVQWPSTGLGILGLVFMYVGMLVLMRAAQEVSPNEAEVLQRKSAKPHRLPGGFCCWTVAPALTFVFWVLLLYQWGPYWKPTIASLDDVNTLLEDMSPFVTSMVQGKLPSSFGDCHYRFDERVRKGELQASDSGAVHRDCRGEGSLTSFSKQTQGNDVNITVRWVEGLETIAVRDLKVLQPDTNVGPQVWNTTLSASFTGLKIWLRVMLGSQLWIDDYMCCHGPFRFQVRASATCNDEHGFYSPIKVEVSDMDDFNWIHRTNWQDEEGNSQGFTVNYGSFDAVQETIRGMVMQKAGNFWIDRPDGSRVSPLDLGVQLLNRVTSRSIGKTCPRMLQ